MTSAPPASTVEQSSSTQATPTAARCGLFIVFEGGDGTGKSSQAQLLAKQLDAVLTRQPGGTELGQKIRAMLLDPANSHLDVRCEALLMAADRAQHVAEVIKPALESGRNVVCDRYLWSSVAYQGHGRQLDPETVRLLSDFAVNGLEPDLVILLDIPVEVGLERAIAAGKHSQGDRFEQADQSFHERVRSAYLGFAKQDPDRWAVVDASGDFEAVTLAIQASVKNALGSKTGLSTRSSTPSSR